MKIILEIPKEKHAVMKGVAGWYEQDLAAWIDQALTTQLAGDLTAIAEDQRKSEPIRAAK